MLRRTTHSIRDELLRPPVEYDAPRKKDNLFLWTVFLLLLVGFSMACWIGSYVIFAKPELPVSYKLLRKIKKIDAPQRFKITAAPKGEFLTPERIYNRYANLSGPAIRELNRQLERSFLRNYSAANEMVPYVTGRFTIMDSYELTPADFVTSGAVALAVSTDFPKVLIEHIYSSDASDAALIKRNLRTGMDVELRRTYELSALIHVARLTDGHLQLTVVPINYGRYIFTGANGGFDLQPPETLNVAAGWPLIRGDRLEAANQAYLDYRTQSSQGLFASRGKVEGQKPPPTAIKGVDLPLDSPATASTTVNPTGAPQVAKSGASAATPAVAAKPPMGPSSLPQATASPAVLLAQAEIPVQKALPVDAPSRQLTSANPGVLKAAPPVQAPGNGASLQPFLAPPTANPTSPPAALAVARTWATYAPGRMPVGKDVRVGEVATLNQRGSFDGEPVYLTGQFVVRAVGENREKGIKRAVLRASSGDNKVRILVDYPTDHPLPSEGSEISRDEQRPYQITDVKQVADGTVNVYVREITD